MARKRHGETQKRRTRSKAANAQRRRQHRNSAQRHRILWRRQSWRRHHVAGIGANVARDIVTAWQIGGDQRGVARKNADT